jgi:transposase-like protein
MNRKQLPVEVKKMIAGRVASGRWTLKRAAETVGYSQSSVRRWKNRYANGAGQTPPSGESDAHDEEPSAQGVPEEPKQRRELNEDVIALLESVTDEQPHLGRKGLRDWMKRHYQVKLSERQLGRFLEESGRARPPVPVKPEVPPRRFEAEAPLDMIQMDLWYVPRPGKGLYFYGLSTLDDHLCCVS